MGPWLPKTSIAVFNWRGNGLWSKQHGGFSSWSNLQKKCNEFLTQWVQPEDATSRRGEDYSPVILSTRSPDDTLKNWTCHRLQKPITRNAGMQLARCINTSLYIETYIQLDSKIDHWYADILSMFWLTLIDHLLNMWPWSRRGPCIYKSEDLLSLLRIYVYVVVKKMMEVHCIPLV